MDVQLRVDHVIEVAVGRLQAVDKRLSRCLVAVPGVVRPAATAQRIVDIDAAYVAVEEGQRIGKAVHAVLADDAEQTHAAAQFDRACSGAVHRLDHLRLVAFGLQPARALIAAVRFRDRDHATGGIVVRLIPRDAGECIVTTVGEQILVAVLRCQLREAIVRPLLPSLADHWVLQAVRPVDAPVHREPFLAASRVPVGGCLVALDVRDVAAIVILLNPRHDAVSRERAQPARVRVVGRADPRKAAVVAILIAIDRLPIAARVVFQRVADSNRLEAAQRKNGRAAQRDACRGCAAS